MNSNVAANEWLFVGAVVPDEAAFHNPAFSRAGQMCQQNLLLGMKHAGAPASAVLAAQPIPSFPRARRLWVGKGRTTLPEGIEVTLLPFLNVTPLKQITIGLAMLWHILRWGWRNRRTRRRIVLTYNLSVPPGVFTWLAARLIGAKAVAMVYDIEIPGQTVPWSIRRRIDLWLHRWILPRYDGIVSISDAIVQDLRPGTTISASRAESAGTSSSRPRARRLAPVRRRAVYDCVCGQSR